MLWILNHLQMVEKSKIKLYHASNARKCVDFPRIFRLNFTIRLAWPLFCFDQWIEHSRHFSAILFEEILLLFCRRPLCLFFCFAFQLVFTGRLSHAWMLNTQNNTQTSLENHPCVTNCARPWLIGANRSSFRGAFALFRWKLCRIGVAAFGK